MGIEILLKFHEKHFLQPNYTKNVVLYFRIEEEEQLDRKISEGKLLKNEKKECSIQ